MPNLTEAIPGTTFLVPIVYFLVSNESFIRTVPIERVLAVATLLVLPVGWLFLNLQGLMLAYFFGRYENEPVMKHVRKNIGFEEKDGKFTVNLDKVLPECFNRRSISCSQQEFDKLFDPFKKLRDFPLSHRRRQSENGENVYYVENVENITYFSPNMPSSYIREVVRYWHISTASGIAAFLGLICGIHINGLLQGNVLSVVLILIIIGVLIVTGGVIQPYFRKKEAIANEYLIIRLLVPYRDKKEDQPSAK